MRTVKALREERASVEAQVRELLDSRQDADWTAEDDQQFEALITQSNDLLNEVNRIEQADDLTASLSDIRDEQASAAGNPALADPELERTALRAWLDSQYDEFRNEVTAEGRQAAELFGLQLGGSINATLRGMFRNDLTTGTGSNDAGNVINSRLVAALQEAMLHYGGILEAADVMTTAKATPVIWPTFDDTANSGSMIAEAASVGTASNPSFSKIQLDAYKGSSGVLKVTWEALRDADVDLAELLGRSFGERLGRLVNNKGTVGTGSSEPTGLVTDATDSGFTTASATAIDFNEVLDLIHSVDVANRANARFMCHDLTIKALRKEQDSNGQYIWQAGTVGGEPDRIYGYPVSINNDMTAIATGVKSLIFGDLSKLKVRLVEGVRIYRLAELYRATDEDGFVALNAFDSKVVDPAAASAGKSIKYLTQA
jgi:HK97 family phage major capsid protein